MAAASPAHSGASAADVSTPSAAGSDEFAAYGYAIGPADPVPEALGARFKDFDKEDVYNDVVAHANIEGALNFVVQFGDDEAQVACDLSDVEIERLLAQPAELRDMRMPIRWINIWNPSAQRGVVEAIGRRYGFSKRLTLSIWAWDTVKEMLIKKKQALRDELVRARYHGLGHGHGHRAHALDKAQEAAKRSVPEDLENGKAPDAAGRGGLAAGGVGGGDGGMNSILAPENLATFNMMQGNLNYTSIDQEALFVCVGANWLHRRPTLATKKTPSLVPPKHWSWFVLCDDYTVLSFHEKAYYSIPRSEDAVQWKKQELESMRSNTVKALRQLSKFGLKADQHKFMQLTSVRQPDEVPGQHPMSEARTLECSSNLFYYLFEDYSASFDILNNSKAALGDISGRILRTADWKSNEDTTNIIPDLYNLNKELRQLHHLFANYKTVIDRLLSSDSEIFDETKVVKEKLSIKARNRFRRLQVQLQSLMLDAITDYLEEKKSLEDTYFSLITQKDSHSTERLTRSATLLAKLSVFFLPISFMTSYFSIQIPHMTDGYTAWTYWGAFAVIASLSFLSLFFFSKVLMFLSEKLDHLMDTVLRWVSDRIGLRLKRQIRALEAEDNMQNM